MYWFLLSILAAVGLLWPATVGATPFTPTNDSQVLERLRTRPSDPAYQELRGLRNELERSPRKIEIAIKVARRYIEQGRTDGDPRYNGYAQAALAPWWNAPHPPPSVLLLRATLRQSNHDFDGALADLNLAALAAPNDGQVWVTRALVHQVRGEYALAKRDCVPLLHLSTELVAVTCLAGISSLEGRATLSYGLIERVLTRSPKASKAEQLWANTVLGEIAVRQGHLKQAETNFRKGITLGADNYLLSAYADLLSTQGRYQEVIALLKDQIRSDNLLLRLVIAENQLHTPQATEHIAALQARFAASHQRGDVVHRREEARFRLELLNDGRGALALALANWKVQREPADLRILLAAALSVGDRSAAKPALDWCNQTRIEDVQVASLLRQLGG
jgi:tetratricopeptide (TPR) repeat protein